MRLRSFPLPVVFAAAALAACGSDHAPSNVQAPGAPQSAKTRTLEAGAAAMQNRAPIDAIRAYLNGFHFYSGNIHGQVEAHHFCDHLNEDVIQCVIYDGNGDDAKLMGIEYIVSEKLFKQLPPEEKHLWHSHAHEVRSGQLIAPGIPKVAEHELMEKLAHTYGKTWHTWHTDMDKALPLGIPKLMMGFTAEGQLNPKMLALRDKRFRVSTAENRESRADIDYPPIDPDADAWQKNVTLQLELTRLASDIAGHATPPTR